MKLPTLVAGTIAATYLLVSPVYASSSDTHARQSVSSFVTSNYAKTKYPIVFNHGMLGFNRIGLDSFGVDYFYQVLPNLARNGANVWASRVSPFNSNEVRGEQLKQQVDDIIAITGAEKVNLIGHSQGGPTSRYVAAIMPSKVASLTSIGSPHKGSPVADTILNVEGTVIQKPLVGVVNFISQAIVFAQTLNGNDFPHDSLATAKSLSLTGAAQFNQRFPAGMPTTACGEGKALENGIYNYSFSGIGSVTNLLDLDSVLGATSLLINNGGDNDGLVPRCSAKFGKSVRDNYNWNHLDEVNQLLGLRSVFSPDPVDVYRQHANRLKLQGL